MPAGRSPEDGPSLRAAAQAPVACSLYAALAWFCVASLRLMTPRTAPLLPALREQAQCTGPAQLRRALTLVADMRARSIALNTHTYTAILNVCIKAGQPELALDVYAQVKRGHGAPAHPVRPGVLRGACLERPAGVPALTHRAARCAIRQMLSEGLTPNLVTYNTLLEVYAKQVRPRGGGGKPLGRSRLPRQHGRWRRCWRSRPLAELPCRLRRCTSPLPCSRAPTASSSIINPQRSLTPPPLAGQVGAGAVDARGDPAPGPNTRGAHLPCGHVGVQRRRQARAVARGVLVARHIGARAVGRVAERRGHGALQARAPGAGRRRRRTPVAVRACAIGCPCARPMRHP